MLYDSFVTAERRLDGPPARENLGRVRRISLSSFTGGGIVIALILNINDYAPPFIPGGVLAIAGTSHTLVLTDWAELA